MHKENIDEYQEIIGGGGFGLVVKNKNGKKAIKFIYEKTDCDKAYIEFKNQEKIYNVLKDFPDIKKLQISTSKSLMFSTQPISVFNKFFSCSYSMCIINPVIIPYLYHIVLNSDYDGSYNRLIGVKNPKGEISVNNPARGFFADSSYIKKNILSVLSESQKGNIKDVKDVAYRMGLLFSIIIFGAEYNPVDVEYLFGMVEDKLNVTILDFGMIEKLNFNTEVPSLKNFNFDTDFYIPTEGKNLKAFIEGFIFSFEYYLRRENNKTKKSNMTSLFESLKKKLEEGID